MTTHQSNASLNGPVNGCPSDARQSVAEQMLQRRDLLAALDHFCYCEFEAGELITPCPGHRALGQPDQAFVRHMEFARSLSARWWDGEMAAA